MQLTWGSTPLVSTALVRNFHGVRELILRSKITATCDGRPMSRWSRITPSKNDLPAWGRSKTRVSDTCNRRKASS